MIPHLGTGGDVQDPGCLFGGILSLVDSYLIGNMHNRQFCFLLIRISQVADQSTSFFRSDWRLQGHYRC